MVKSKYCILDQKNQKSVAIWIKFQSMVMNKLLYLTVIANNSIQVFKNPKQLSKYSMVLVKLDLYSENQYGIPKHVSVKMEIIKSDIYSRHIRQDTTFKLLIFLDFKIFRALGW